MMERIFTDLHHHLIFGIDDGAQSEQEMQQMINIACQDGIKQLVATAHMLPGIRQFPYEVYLSRLQAANAYCQSNNLPLKVYAGAEVYYTEETVRLLAQGQVLTLAGHRIVLVEFSPHTPYDEIEKAVRKIGNTGYEVILAHAERYQCLRKIDKVHSLRNLYGVQIQVNANTVITNKGLFSGLWLKKMFAENAIDIIATDSHDTTVRRSCMAKAYAEIAGRYDEALAKKLCVDNPARIIHADDNQA